MQNVSTTQSTSAHVTGQGVKTRGGTCHRGRGRVSTCGGRHVVPNISSDWQQMAAQEGDVLILLGIQE